MFSRSSTLHTFETILRDQKSLLWHLNSKNFQYLIWLSRETVKYRGFKNWCWWCHYTFGWNHDLLWCSKLPTRNWLNSPIFWPAGSSSSFSCFSFPCASSTIMRIAASERQSASSSPDYTHVMLLNFGEYTFRVLDWHLKLLLVSRSGRILILVETKSGSRSWQIRSFAQKQFRELATLRQKLVVVGGMQSEIEKKFYLPGIWTFHYCNFDGYGRR